MHDYEHRQPGMLLRVAIGLCGVFGATVFVVDGLSRGDEGALIVACVIAAVSAVVFILFHSLTVCVSHNTIAISFGIGLVRKSFVIDDIQSAAIVKNHWYNGWGIKWIRGGWLYNVSGFDAVEIKVKNGRRYRIGTDQPGDLLEAIESRIATSS